MKMRRFLFFLCLIVAVDATCVGQNTTIRNILLDFYSSTSGPSWDVVPIGKVVPWNWTDDYCQWIGVTCWTSRHYDGCDNVVEIILPRVGLNGFVPESFGQLPLQLLNLADNPKLQGELPSTLFSGMSLVQLQLFHTGLSGALPDLGFPCNLMFLDLHSTKTESVNVSGCDLTLVDISDTLISSFPDRVPRSIPERFSDLLYFDGSNTRLAASLPLSFFCAQSNLQKLYLSYNNYTGSISECLGDLPQLQILYLDHNQFTDFSNINTNYYSLLYLDVSYNALQTDLDQRTLIDFFTLNTGDFSHNQLQGDFNHLMGRTPALYLNDNLVSGIIAGSYYAAVIDLRETNVSKFDPISYRPSSTIFSRQYDLDCPAIVPVSGDNTLIFTTC